MVRHERWAIAPYFIVDDVVATANFYRDKLGFHYERFFGEPPAFCMVERRGVVIMLSQLPVTGLMRPNHAADPSGDSWDAYIWVDDADALCAEYKSKGVSIARGVATSRTAVVTSISRTATVTAFVLGTTSRDSEPRRLARSRDA